jgi:hypothetical protein
VKYILSRIPGTGSIRYIEARVVREVLISFAERRD